MTGVLGLLIAGGGGIPASTHAMSIGTGGVFGPFFSTQFWGFADEAYGNLYSPGGGSLTPDLRQTVQISEISFSATTAGSTALLFALQWTTTPGLASKIVLDGVTYLMSDPGTVASTSASTATISIATPGVVTLAGHGFTAGYSVMFTTTGALPTGLLPDVVYFVIAPTTNTFNVSATVGGAAITTSGTQSGVHTLYSRPRRQFTVAGAPATAPTWARAPVTVTASAVNPTTWTSTAHGFSNGQGATFTTSGSLPSGLVVGTRYFIISATSNTFQVAATVGGAAIGNGAAQSGAHVVSRSIDVVIS